MSEIAAEIAEEAAEAVVVARNNPILLAGVAIVSLAAGGFVGYKYAEKKLALKFDEALERELALSKRFLKEDLEADAVLLGEDHEEREEELEKALVRQIRNYNKSPVRPEQIQRTERIIEETITTATGEERTVGIKSIDEDDDGGSDVSETEPYFISFNDYHSGDIGFTQMALTYYAQDDTLADEADNIVDNIEATIGVDNLDVIRRGDKLTRFVRNPSSELEFEVAKYDISYRARVLGEDG